MFNAFKDLPVHLISVDADIWLRLWFEALSKTERSSILLCMSCVEFFHEDQYKDMFLNQTRVEEVEHGTVEHLLVQIYCTAIRK